VVTWGVLTRRLKAPGSRSRGIRRPAAASDSYTTAGIGGRGKAVGDEQDQGQNPPAESMHRTEDRPCTCVGAQHQVGPRVAFLLLLQPPEERRAAPVRLLLPAVRGSFDRLMDRLMGALVFGRWLTHPPLRQERLFEGALGRGLEAQGHYCLRVLL
jgi:hypothetical protein